MVTITTWSSWQLKMLLVFSFRFLFILFCHLQLWLEAIRVRWQLWILPIVVHLHMYVLLQGQTVLCGNLGSITPRCGNSIVDARNVRYLRQPNLVMFLFSLPYLTNFVQKKLQCELFAFYCCSTQWMMTDVRRTFKRLFDAHWPTTPDSC